MALKNSKWYHGEISRNGGIFDIDQIQIETRAAVPTDSDLANGRIVYVTGTGLRAYIGGGWVTIGAAGGGAVTSFDQIYDTDKTMAVDETTFTLQGTAALGAGAVLTITNAGTGKDITAPGWSIISTGAVGILEIASGGTINASGGACTIGKTATATSFAGTVTIAEGFTLTAGALTHSVGATTLVDNSNIAASLTLTNATATTYAGIAKITAAAMTSGTALLVTLGGMTTGKGISVVAAATTEGYLLYLSATEATLTSGKYIYCYDGAAADFSVGIYGTTTIAGNAATDVLILSAGDMLVTAGKIVIAKAANSVALSVTNDTATTASVIVFAGAAVFTGTTTTSFMTITPSGMVAGTAVYLPVAAMTTGKALQIVGNVLTQGQLIAISSSSAVITTTGRLFSVTHSGATGTTAILSEFVSNASDETEVVKITCSAALALGVAFDVSAVAMTTGTGIKMADLDALTTGIGLHIASAATAITTTGRLAYINHTGVTGTTATLVEIASAAGDETVIFKVTASGALALGVAVAISGAAITTGKGIQMSDLNALTTGIGLHIASSATVMTGTGRLVYVNHTGATGTTAILNEFASAAGDETVIMKVTASAALALGVALQVSGAAITTGAGITANDLNALTTGIGLHIASSSAALTGAGRLVYVNHTGAATAATTAKIMEIASNATEDTEIFKVTASAALAAGLAVNISAVAMTTGTALAISDLNALTSGMGLYIASTATAITGAGRLIYSYHNGATGTSAILNEFKTVATDETVLFQLTASAALAAGMVENISAAAMTTGTALNFVSMDALTTGVGINLHSNSADVTARDLVHIHNDNAAAVGANPITVVQDGLVSTHFYRIMKMNSNTLWMGDGTTANAALAATTGDILINGGSNKPEYCTNGAGSLWTALV
jgi:hypothetical protein